MLLLTPNLWGYYIANRSPFTLVFFEEIGIFKSDICKSENIFHNLQYITIFEWLLKFISWWGLSQIRITVAEEKCSSFNFIL